jgi:hypothetical protein
MLWLMILRGRRDLVFPRLKPAGKLEACNTMGRLCPEQADQKKLEQGWLCVSGVLSNLMACARGRQQHRSHLALSFQLNLMKAIINAIERRTE